MPQRTFRFAAGLAPLLAFLATAAPAPVRAQVANPTIEATQTQMGAISVTLGASVGQVGGTAYERVYAPEVRDFKLSELKWDLQDIVMAGVQGRAEVGRFRVNLGYWGAVNKGDGDMVDTDWEFLNTTSEDQWTKQSHHPDTDLDSGSIFDINLDVKAFSRGSFSLSGMFGYRRNEWDWRVHGGEYTYTVDRNGDGFITPDEFRTYQGRFPDDQLIIKYRQSYDVPYFGLGCEGTWGFVQLQAHLLYSPWVSAEDHDNHVLRDTTFDGDFSDGDWFGAGASATWFFMPRWYATMSVEYQKFDEIVGDVAEDSPDGRFVYGDGGSVELETVLLLFGVGVRF